MCRNEVLLIKNGTQFVAFVDDSLCFYHAGHSGIQQISVNHNPPWLAEKLLISELR